MVLRIKAGALYMYCTTELHNSSQLPKKPEHKKESRGIGERAPQLRAFVVLAEDPDLFPRTHTVVHNPGSGDLMTSPDLHRHQACLWCTDTYSGKTVTDLFLFLKHI